MPHVQASLVRPVESADEVSYNVIEGVRLLLNPPPPSYVHVAGVGPSAPAGVGQPGRPEGDDVRDASRSRSQSRSQVSSVHPGQWRACTEWLSPAPARSVPPTESDAKGPTSEWCTDPPARAALDSPGRRSAGQRPQHSDLSPTQSFHGPDL